MHKVFISYHHENDQYYKEELLLFNSYNNIFIDSSVSTGDVDVNLPDQSIKNIIRDDYLRDSSVTILLVGTETKRRKHIDWEVSSSMFDGTINKKSGILVVQLPTISNGFYITAPHGLDEKNKIHPSSTVWHDINTRLEYEDRYPYLPDRIIDNLYENEALISVVGWNNICDANKLRYLIEISHNDRLKCKYDMSRPLRKNDS